jgi:hypothetical protein
VPVVGRHRRKGGVRVDAALAPVHSELAVPRTFPGNQCQALRVPALHHLRRNAQGEAMWSMLVENAGALVLVLIGAVGVAAAIGTILDRYVD